MNDGDVERHRALAGNCREVEARQRVGMRPLDCHYATEPRYLQDLPRSSRPTVTRSEHDGSVGRSVSRSWSAFTCSHRQEYYGESRSCCIAILSQLRENNSREIKKKNIADYKSSQVTYSAGSITDSNCQMKKRAVNSTLWVKSTAVEVETNILFYSRHSRITRSCGELPVNYVVVTRVYVQTKLRFGISITGTCDC